MNSLEKSWYQDKGWSRSLQPLASLYGWLSSKRRNDFQTKQSSLWQSPVPIIIVGNVSVGGTGKTPVTIALINYLQEQGYTPGVVSRGYGGKANSYPLAVEVNTKPSDSGDEPLLIKQRTGCPVVIDPDRVSAVQHLLANNSCDVIISDDGLQHYALQRDIEIAVVDGRRGLGNERLLPAGPLRELPDRLQEVDLVLVNGGDWQATVEFERFELSASAVIHLKSGEQQSLSDWQNKKINALAGIGNPERFFQSLTNLGVLIQSKRALSDHHEFIETDVAFDNDLPVLMTEKDAVKCRELVKDNLWYMPVDARIPQAALTQLHALLSAINK